MRIGAGTKVTPNIRLVRLLGEGGMGSLWVADHLTLETQGAVKFISPGLPRAALPALLKRFEREAKAAARIRSPHVVEIKDLGVMPGGRPFIVMELLHGESLGKRLACSGALGLDETATIVKQVAKALGAAHALGIVHRDIKPDNIFLVAAHDELLVKVLDFGIAKISGAPQADRGLTATGSLLGTPAFMSPEQLLSTKDADHSADLWALAVLAYRMLTGRLPFRGETVTALCMAICAAQFEPPTAIRTELPAALDSLFARALGRDHAARFPSARELAEAFVRALAPGLASQPGEPPARVEPTVPGAPAALPREDAVPHEDEPAPAGEAEIVDEETEPVRGPEQMPGPVARTDDEAAAAGPAAAGVEPAPQDAPTTARSRVVPPPAGGPGAGGAAEPRGSEPWRPAPTAVFGPDDSQRRAAAAPAGPWRPPATLGLGESLASRPSAPEPVASPAGAEVADEAGPGGREAA
ncbi:MAG: protein kinase [Deltaproteobacteria bacterium]|nr:protein kinase [Deltaproteobacteria bacterium]